MQFWKFIKSQINNNKDNPQNQGQGIEQQNQGQGNDQQSEGQGNAQQNQGKSSEQQSQGQGSEQQTQGQGYNNKEFLEAYSYLIQFFLRNINYYNFLDHLKFDLLLN